MRTTLDVEEDVLVAAKEIAHQRGLSTGKVISDLARQALTQSKTETVRNGWTIIPVQPGAGVVTLELVNRLRDEIP